MMLHLDTTPLFYGGDELQRIKLERMQEALRESGLDGLLLLKHEAVRYVTGFYAKGYRPFLEFEYASLVPARGLPVLCTGLDGEEERARLRSRVADVRRLPKLRDWAATLASLLADHGMESGRVGFDLLPDFLRAGLEARLPDVKLVDASGMWTAVTAIKHPLEVDLLREACRIVQAGTQRALEVTRPGVTEVEVAAEAEYVMRRMGSEMTPFISVVASGSNAAVWERLATERTIGDREMVILDFGCVFRGYTGDFARTIIVGEPTSAQKRLYRAAYLALQEGMKAIRPGVPCGAIDALMRQVLREEGLERYAAPWAFGHQLGYGLHGAPVLGSGVDEPLQAGMVVNIEPSLNTFDDLEVGGVEIEDTLLVVPGGSQRLTDLPYDENLLG